MSNEQEPITPLASGEEIAERIRESFKPLTEGLSEFFGSLGSIGLRIRWANDLRTLDQLETALAAMVLMGGDGEGMTVADAYRNPLDEMRTSINRYYEALAEAKPT